MEADRTRHPRVSPTVKQWVGWVLTAVWIAGVAFMMEILHTPLWGPIALLAAVGVVELGFYRWNEGRWPGVADEPKDEAGSTAG
ncbi:MAG TPA: hypothetical protein VK646_13030 [Actinomycetota bacterium]|nr:hypothetical protein [Actinomycetota bacterium]